MHSCTSNIPLSAQLSTKSFPSSVHLCSEDYHKSSSRFDNHLLNFQHSLETATSNISYLTAGFLTFSRRLHVYSHLNYSSSSSIVLSVEASIYTILRDLSYALMYLAEDWQLISDVSMRQVHSTGTVMCVVSDRCFATVGQCLWNSLPSKQRRYDSVGELKMWLKTTVLCDI